MWCLTPCFNVYMEAQTPRRHVHRKRGEGRQSMKACMTSEALHIQYMYSSALFCTMCRVWGVIFPWLASAVIYFSPPQGVGMKTKPKPYYKCYLSQ